MHRNARLALRSLVVSAVGFLAIGLASPASSVAQEIAVKNGDSIAFLGDSITQQGAGSPAGYVRLTISGLEANGVKATAIPAGISGHKSDQMLARLQKDVLDKKPTWMTLSCGVNDVWHQERDRGILIDDYKRNITAIVDRAQAAGVKVMILTATMIKEDQSNALNQKLVPYNEFLRGLAKEKDCLLADLNADMQAAIAQPAGGEPRKGNQLTSDGVHMNAKGNQMMALGVLRAFGVDETGIEKAKEVWLDLPGTADVTLKAPLTFRQFEALKNVAAREGKSVPDLLRAELDKDVQALLKDAGTTTKE